MGNENSLFSEIDVSPFLIRFKSASNPYQSRCKSHSLLLILAEYEWKCKVGDKAKGILDICDVGITSANFFLELNAKHVHTR